MVWCDARPARCEGRPSVTRVHYDLAVATGHNTSMQESGERNLIVST